MPANLQNWSGHHTFQAAHVHRPDSVEELQALVARSRKLKVIGSRHSFNDIADSTEALISLENFPDAIAIDRGQNSVTVNGGITYGRLCPQLHEAGYALHNMASLPHITVAGAVSTATHGSGDAHGNLATAVAALELVTGDGEQVLLSREQPADEFQGAVVGLGGLGVMARITLDTVPTFAMQQTVYDNLPMTQLAEHFDEITTDIYSMSLFTDWQTDSVNQIWLKRPVTDAAGTDKPSTAKSSIDEPMRDMLPEFFGGTLASAHRHPVLRLSAEPCTLQMGMVGPWYERLPHFRTDHTPASGDELQTEYFVPREHAVAAMQAIARLRKPLAPILLISEVRTIAADTLWMSPSYGRASVGLHFSWKKDWPAVRQLLPILEEQLAPFQARPHWGKLFTLSPARVQSLYPKLADFRELLQTYDPAGKFRNTYLDTYIFGTS